MLTTILIIILALAYCFFAIRWVSLRRALHTTRQEITLVRQDLSQNQMLHLPLQDSKLTPFYKDLNALLADVQRERRDYAKRERDFQEQIEAVSHDLRTPLTVILGHLKLLRQHEQTALTAKPEVTEAIDVIEQKTESMKRLVDQFYDYSRLAADDMQLQLTRVDAGRLLREVLVGNYTLLAERNLTVDTHLPEEPLWVLGEDAALGRIFQNLLQNASRYAAHQLDIDIVLHNDRLCLHFTNDSTALQLDDVPRLFDRFYTPDDSRHHGSTGLGLTVARGLAEEMQGTLDVSAQPQKNGLSICFRLCLKAL